MITVNGNTIEWTCWNCGLGSVWDKKYPGMYRRPWIIEDEEGTKRIVCPFCGRSSRADDKLLEEILKEEPCSES